MITLQEAVFRIAILGRDYQSDAPSDEHARDVQAIRCVVDALLGLPGPGQVVEMLRAEMGSVDRPADSFTKFAEDLWKDLAAGGRPIPPARVARPPYREGICPRDGSPCESAGNGSKCCGEILK